MKDGKSKEIAAKGLQNVDDIIQQALANSDDVVTGKMSYQRAAQSAMNLRVALKGIIVQHQLGGDVKKYITQA